MTNRIVAITGATGTLGQAVVQRFSQAQDWDWRGCSRSGGIINDESVDSIDVRVDDVVRRWFDTMGHCDAVVTCAGVSRVESSLDILSHAWFKVIDVNLGGTFLAAREAIRYGATRVVTIGSIHGGTPSSYPMRAAYTASKGGVLALTQALAVEFAPRGVAVNSVAPGHLPVLMSTVGAGQALLDAAEARTPTGKLATPAEVADVIFWLCDSAPASMTGQNLVIDGGFTMNTYSMES